ncbi:hypothetical protein V9T40_004836 [Parthenolecanium corni]|uniref:Uncharacterized protein n=1 Tax=Parthenolecanium corni TaxID=536013 RepID=A0AAN9TCQ8_9HEMI
MQDSVGLLQIRRRDQPPPPSIRCSQQQTTGTSYLTGTSHFTKDLCPPNEYSIQNLPVSVETVRSRKVQFSSDGESNAASSVKNEFDAGPELMLERIEKDTIVDRNSYEEEDFVTGRSEYLWCETADERNLIADLMASGKTEFM